MYSSEQFGILRSSLWRSYRVGAVPSCATRLYTRSWLWMVTVLPRAGLLPVSKNLSDRRPTKADVSPVTLRSAPPSAKTQKRVSQVLQVQVPLNPLRKKSSAKDVGPPRECSRSRSHPPATPSAPPSPARALFIYCTDSPLLGHEPLLGRGAAWIGTLVWQIPKGIFKYIYVFLKGKCWKFLLQNAQFNFINSNIYWKSVIESRVFLF